MHERIRDAMLGSWGGVVASRPRVTLLVCGLLTVVAFVLTVTRLEFRSDRSELMDPDLAWNRAYSEYKERFDRWDDVIVCIDGDPDDARVDALARRIADAMREDDRVREADAGFDVRETGPRLFAAAPAPVFDETLDHIARARSIAAAGHATAALAVALGQLEADRADAGALDELETFLAPYLAGLTGGAPDFGFLVPDQPRWLPLVSEVGSGRLRFIQVQLSGSGAAIDQISANLSWLRGFVTRFGAESGIDGLEWGVTGIPAIEADETAQSIRDSTLASIVAFLLITLLMLAVFRGVVVPLLAAGSLLVGMTWAFGWLVLTIGHLQLLSVVFSVILLGLGIDFALHFVARLELVQDEHADLPSATRRVFRGIGPGMLTGAVTTAAAFGATALTKFKGMAEMGVIAGGGILLCLVAVLSCFPAALALTGRWKQIIRHRPGGERARFAAGRLDIVDFHPVVTLVVAIGVVVILLALAFRVRYDPNILNLHPPGIESVEWERRIVLDDARSVWAALVETTAGEAPDLVDRLRRQPGVSGVGAMGLLVPADAAERAARIAAVRESPIRAVATAPDWDALRLQLGAVRFGLRRVADDDADADRLHRLAVAIETALASTTAVDAATAHARMTMMDERFRQGRDALDRWLTAALAPIAPGPRDLPPILRNRWTDDDLWLLRVYPAADPAGRSVLDPEVLPQFVATVRDVAPSVFGPPVQIQESSELIKSEYSKAAVYALTAILLLLLLDFRSLWDTLCAIIPVTVGFIGVFGVMGLFGLPLNFANIIVMPLIFGIGVDAGVHVVHRWRAEPYGRPAGLSGGTGRGVTLTMLSTMIGFGCMLLAKHRGIRSLGLVMVTGLGISLIACYVVLPAILRLRTRNWRS